MHSMQFEGTNPPSALCSPAQHQICLAGDELLRYCRGQDMSSPTLAGGTIWMGKHTS